MPKLATRLTRTLQLRHPVISAPMAFAAGGALAAAVSRAGGLGFIGGGYGDLPWLEQQLALAEGERIGVGFITWSLARSPSLLAVALEHRPAAVMLSFGDPRPFAEKIRAGGAALICQCQNMAHVCDAVEAGATVVVAQGAEAGGHGALLTVARKHCRRQWGSKVRATGRRSRQETPTTRPCGSARLRAWCIRSSPPQ
jgi:nitronate monooxygenase